MRKTKIVADTSCDLLSLKHVAFDCAPMKIITSEREFVDDENLDVNEMVEYLDKYKGKSKSSDAFASGNAAALDLRGAFVEKIHDGGSGDESREE